MEHRCSGFLVLYRSCRKATSQPNHKRHRRLPILLSLQHLHIRLLRRLQLLLHLQRQHRLRMQGLYLLQRFHRSLLHPFLLRHRLRSLPHL